MFTNYKDMIDKLCRIADAELPDLQAEFEAIMNKFNVILEIGLSDDGQTLGIVCIDQSANVSTAEFTSRFVNSDLPSSIEAALKPILYKLYEISGSTPEDGNI